MVRRIKDVLQLKHQSLNGGLFFILLNGSQRSDRWIHWDEEEELFTVKNKADGIVQKLTEKQITNLDYSNIGVALKQGLLFKDTVLPMEVKNKKSKQIKKIQEGRVWLNVIRGDNDQELFTLSRGFKTEKGWINSNFFQMEKGDLDSIRKLLSRYEEDKRNPQISLQGSVNQTPMSLEVNDVPLSFSF